MENHQVLGISPDLNNLVTEKISSGSVTKHVRFSQTYNGIPVFRSATVVSIDRANRVYKIVSDYYPGIDIRTKPSISIEQALAIAWARKDPLEPSNELEAKLFIYVNNESTYHLAWIVIAPSEVEMVIIDAQSGDILEVVPTIIDYDNGGGWGFIPDPGTSERQTSFPSGYDFDSIRDWCVLRDLSTQTGDDPWRIQGRYAWSSGDPYRSGFLYDPVTELYRTDFQYSIDEPGFEEVNAYYHIDTIRRYLNTITNFPTSQLRWNNMAGTNTEAIEFIGRSSRKNPDNYYNFVDDYIKYHVGRFEGGITRDGGEDLSLVIHEYGHALHDALMEMTGLDLSSDGSGVTEGIADYLAISYRRSLQPSNPYHPNARNNFFDPSYGDGILPPSSANFANHWDGLDSHEQLKVWASALMDLEYNDATNPASGQNLGRAKTSLLALASTQTENINSSAWDFYRALIDADVQYYGGVDTNAINTVFVTNRGISPPNPYPGPPAAPTGLTITNLGQIGQYIQLAWNANSEPDLNHYNVWRECTYPSDPDCDLQVISSRTWTSYTDTRVTIQGHYPEMEIFYYYVTAVDDASQESEKSAPASTWGEWSYLKGMDQVAEESLPEAYALGANHPNPFNPVTTIRYDLPEASSVSLVIYDIAGREIRSWNLQEQAGYRQLIWDGKNQSGQLVPTGIYIYRLVAASVESDQRFTASRKMVLIR